MLKNFALIFIIFSSLPLIVGANDDRGDNPYFASIKPNEANMRKGPGKQYPIMWVYRKAGMPVEVTDSYHNWKRVKDIEGESGWIHQSLISGKRNAFVSANAKIYSNPSTDSRNIANIEPKVMVSLLECKELWCRIRVSGHKGWIRKNSLWGVYEHEIF